VSVGNFDFLQRRWPELYQQTAKAETFVHVEAEVTAIRLRCFGELAIAILFREKGLSLPLGGRQFDNLRYLEEIDALDRKKS